ncbi:MAG TPA: hypothetical protein DCS93_14820 [Microscillaceae bacterium]|nr:hypothetical protein [Microscillaceae bacterium]
MIKTYPLLLFICTVSTCLLSNCDYRKSTQTQVSTPEDTLVQIPNEWIEKLRTTKDFEKESPHLINEFYLFLYEENPWDSTTIQNWSSVNPTFVNLDTSPENELLLNIKINRWELFSVIKKINQQWYLLYSNAFGGPIANNKITIHANDPAKKIIELETIHSQTPGLYGTGIKGCFKKVFFRIENNRLKVALSVVSNHRTFDFAELHIVNAFVKADVYEVNQKNIGVHYMYTFSPGSRLQGFATYPNASFTFESLENDLFKGDFSVEYQWNNTDQAYELQDSTEQQKLAVFHSGSFLGHDFYQAFRPTLDSLSTKGDGRPYTKPIVQQILKEIAQLPKDTTCIPCGKTPPDYYQWRKKQQDEKNQRKPQDKN